MIEGLSLDRLHTMLDDLSMDLQEINQSIDHEEDYIHPSQLPFLTDVCQDIFGYWSTYGMQLPAGLRFPRKLLNQFTRNFDSVEPKQAKLLAEGLIVYLRSIEGQVASETVESSVRTISKPTENHRKKEEAESAVKKLEYGWIVLKKSDEVREVIAEISGLLDRIVHYTKTTNVPPKDFALTQIERSQLIAILETALQMLKGPMVEKGFLKKAAEVLNSSVEKTAEKQTEAVLGKLSNLAKEKLVKLILLAMGQLS